MKRILYLILAILPFACSQNEKKPETKSSEPLAATKASTSNDLPNLPIHLDSGAPSNARELGGKTVLILFQPDCDHCQREAVDIRKHIDSFKEYQLYFISAATLEEVLKFAEEYELKSYKNIHWGTTTVQDVLSSFGPIDAPSVYIYSKDKKLVKHFNGETPVEQMLSFL